MRRTAAVSLLPNEPSTPARFGPLLIDHARRQVSAAGTVVALQPIEYDALVVLTTYAGRTLTREQLLHLISAYLEKHLDRAVDTVVCRLRRKLGRHIAPVTQPCVGYRLEMPAASDSNACSNKQLSIVSMEDRERVSLAMICTTIGFFVLAWIAFVVFKNVTIWTIAIVVSLPMMVGTLFK